MPELMELVTKESGKPLGGLNGIGSGMEVGGAIAWTHATADLELPVEVIQDNDDARVEVHRKPLGVVASITPWNWPLMIAIWHVIPALRAGNTVVMKPASSTPTATLRFVELANTILPPGVLNIITGESGVGSAIAKHPGIDKIVFTGSTPTGRSIMQNAAANLKRLTLELGGNDAGIVLPDVDPKAIAPKLFGVGFHNNGQTCACLKRLYGRQHYDDVGAELARIAGEPVSMTVSPRGPARSGANKAQLNFVRELVEMRRSRRAHRRRRQGEGGCGLLLRADRIADAKDGKRVVDEVSSGAGAAGEFATRTSMTRSVAPNDNRTARRLDVVERPRKSGRTPLRLECGTPGSTTRRAAAERPVRRRQHPGWGDESAVTTRGIARRSNLKIMKR